MPFPFRVGVAYSKTYCPWLLVQHSKQCRVFWSSGHEICLRFTPQALLVVELWLCFCQFVLQVEQASLLVRWSAAPIGYLL